MAFSVLGGFPTYGREHIVMTTISIATCLDFENHYLIYLMALFYGQIIEVTCPRFVLEVYL
jgi:hypothetical protein